MSDSPREQFKLQDTPTAPQQGPWQHSVMDYQFGANAMDFRAQANNELIGKGVLTDLQFNFGAEHGTKGTSWLQAHISNVPEVSQGIQNLDDLKALGGGIGTGLQNFGQQALHYLETPNSVRDSILQLGPVLDNATNYYANTRADQVGKDAQTALGAAAEAIERSLSYPMKPEQRGEQAGSLMPLFLFEGNAKEPIQPATAQQLSLEKMSESELSQLGILRITRKAGKGGDWPVLNERSSPDVVQQTTPAGCVAAMGNVVRWCIEATDSN